MSGSGRFTGDRERRLHDRYRLLAAASVDGRIDPEDAAELEAHLLTCDSCSADLAGMLADNRLLAAPARVAAPGPHVREAVLGAARGPGGAQRPGARSSWAVLVAAGLILALVGFRVLVRDGLPPGAGSCPVLAGVTAWWSFDDETVERLSGSEGQVTGRVAFQPGVHGMALDVSAPDAEAISGAGVGQLGRGNFTIALWVRLSGGEGLRAVLDRYWLGEGRGWTLFVDEGSVLFSATGIEEGIDVKAATRLDGAWHHVAITRTGRTFSIFIDGVLRASNDLRPGDEAVLDADIPLRFGRAFSTVLAEPSLGQLDEVLIWSGRAVSAAEIRQLDEASGPNPCAPGANPSPRSNAAL